MEKFLVRGVVQSRPGPQAILLLPHGETGVGLEGFVGLVLIRLRAPRAVVVQEHDHQPENLQNNLDERKPEDAVCLVKLERGLSAEEIIERASHAEVNDNIRDLQYIFYKGEGADGPSKEHDQTLTEAAGAYAPHADEGRRLKEIVLNKCTCELFLLFIQLHVEEVVLLHLAEV